MIVLKISLIIIAFYAITRDGMIAGKLRSWLDEWLNTRFGPGRADTIRAPLWGCLTCMASVWGLLLCILYAVPAWHIPETVLMVCGLNYLLNFYVADRE